MKKEIVFPKLSSKVLSGVIIEWTTEIGQTIQKGEVLYSVETDKAVHEIESPFTGKIIAVHRELGDEVNAGDLIATIEESEEV
ncbi:biotin/lipoyl-containing protein [Facklamia miroungae]|uniref:Dihydrolipoamide dehydrogenase/pyruvate dehydrogenase E2 component (Dihydrolipoamide acetyltransferase)/2-oxoglutarate dehydrogenase E2 component (Dihydrolipoamide succinyltransferase) n=1 Tax=Facklamia miroungae TaxID=120956 RepID=A0A1G7RT16_9LACT|nr:biotin/lipoyl-containing protein [Facklamia miroungae]NKZ29287.1 biotin/lipoyl-binding protein [Facklamia miroungae]SDG13865.1 dihydrolipoamide dehydrogenase/pyruvate dehydrogenase E2 component (dihydrolipoamide acetyltransferase)/2-oxoglutarate dehydrogenase E2 component (dihydrolipoamide succinyltransferase) [Facklamia miroungae]